MIKILLPLFFVFSFYARAQQVKFNTESELVSRGDLEASVYPQDTAANAFYIYENGFSEIEDGKNFNLFTTYTAKLKILNKKGYQQANIRIALSKNDRKTEQLHDLKASSFKLVDGKIIEKKLNKARVYTEENENYDLVKFTFPDVSPGSVLVYSYTVESPFLFDFYTWRFQEDIPKLYSRYETKIPGNFNYNIILVGELKMDSNEQDIIKNCFHGNGGGGKPGECLHTVYTMRDIPAFIKEKYISSENNFISKIAYELKEVTQLDGMVNKYTRQWKDVDRQLERNENIGRQLRKNHPVKNLLSEEISAKPNTLEKAKEILAFVKENYKWNGDYGIFSEMNIKDLMEDKSGNVSSLNILLHNLYENEGFKVHPLISATRKRGFPTKVHPVLSDFNYLMVQLELDGKTYLLDATEPYLDFGEIPFRALNQYGRLLNFDKGSSWIDFEPHSISSISYRDSLNVHADGTASGVSQQILRGYHAFNARKELDEVESEVIAQKINLFQENTHVLKSEIRNKKLPEKPLLLNYTLNNSSQKINDRIYLQAFSFLFFDKNPFQLKERHYPIDFGYKDRYSYDVQIKIPENYNIVEIPEKKLLSLPNNTGKLIFNVVQLDEHNLIVRCQANFQKAVYSSGYYNYLKKFLDELIGIQTQSIIVLKENT